MKNNFFYPNFTRLIKVNNLNKPLFQEKYIKYYKKIMPTNLTWNVILKLMNWVFLISLNLSMRLVTNYRTEGGVNWGRGHCFVCKFEDKYTEI